jgi:hypothetical protein
MITSRLPRYGLRTSMGASMEGRRTDVRRIAAIAAIAVVFAGSYAVGRATVKHHSARGEAQAGLPVAATGAVIPSSIGSVPAAIAPAAVQVQAHTHPSSQAHLTASVRTHTVRRPAVHRPAPAPRTRHVQATHPTASPRRHASPRHAHAVTPAAPAPQPPPSTPPPSEAPVASAPSAAAKGPPRSGPPPSPHAASKPAKSGGGSFDSSG